MSQKNKHLASTRAELVDDLSGLSGIDRVKASMQWAVEKYQDPDNNVGLLTSLFS